MPNTRTVLQELADELVAKDINATTDPRAAVPPCVLVPPPSTETPTNCGSNIQSSLWVLAPGPLDLNAWDAIDSLVSAVVAYLDEPATRWAWQSVNRNLAYTLNPLNPAGPLYPAAEIVLYPYPIAD